MPKAFPALMTALDLREVLLYLFFVFLAYILVRLFFYNAVEMDVQRNSRCIREKLQGSEGGVYTVGAVAGDNTPLYSISYDLTAKSYAIQCSCPKGDTVNIFENIKVYDQRNPTRPVKEGIQISCGCDRPYDAAIAGGTDHLYYTGYPGLQRFMTDGDRSFFQGTPTSCRAPS